MKDFQVILRNEFIIDQKGSKESKINNNIKTQELIKEGYIVKSIHTESGNFHESGYSSNKKVDKKIYFVEIYILQLHQNL